MPLLPRRFTHASWRAPSKTTHPTQQDPRAHGATAASGSTRTCSRQTRVTIIHPAPAVDTKAEKQERGTAHTAPRHVPYSNNN